MIIVEIWLVLLLGVIALPMILMIMLVFFTGVSLILMYAGLGIGAIVKAIRSRGKRKS